MEFYLLLVLFAHSLPGLLAGPPVDVMPDRIILLENQPLEVRCRVRQPIAYCRFAVPGINDGLSLRPGIPPHQGIQYLGAGLEQGECGMLIQRVSSKHSGTINCSMGFSDEPTESRGNLTLIVARPPDPPILQVFPGSNYRDSFLEGESIQASCRIINARPVANISWYLGAEPIYDRLGPTIIEEENGFKSISQNMTRKVTYLDHGKDLKCVAGHIALGQGNINHSIYKLNIRFPPKPKSQELEKFGFTIGQPEKIVVTFQANPIPDIVWKVDQDNLKQGTRDRTGRFEAGILQHKGPGMWDAILRINTVRPEEVEKRYTLIAQNELGHASYKVAISTSPEPPADITAGTIVGIVIAVLVILLLVFILIFARATGRWCFAGGIPRPPGESLVRLRSFKSFLGDRSQRSPQKVNSLVYKDYTLVRHADGTKAYVSPEDKTQLLLEGTVASPMIATENEKKRISVKNSESDSDSDSAYEVPVEKEEPKSLDDSAATDKIEMKRTGSFPTLEDGASAGDNGRINLPPYLIPLETSFDSPAAKHKRSNKRDKRGFPLEETFASRNRRKSSDAQESTEDAEVRRITEHKDPKRFSGPDNAQGNLDPSPWSEPTKPEPESKSAGEARSEEEREDGEAVDRPKTIDLEYPTELFPRNLTGKPSRGFSLPEFPVNPPKRKERKPRKFEPNPLRKMFDIKRGRKEESGKKFGPRGDGGRYGDADLSQIRSDTESADHGSADKSSVSKLTSEKQPKKLMSGLLGSFRKGMNKDKVADNDSVTNPSSFEITVKEQPEDVGHGETIRAEGIVYAELDMARSPGSVMRRDDEKTEYAEIIYPGSKLTVERATEDLRKSRENLTSSRENLTEVDEAFSAASPDGKKEAAV